MAYTLRKTLLRMLCRQSHKSHIDNDYFVEDGRVSEMKLNGLLIPKRRCENRSEICEAILYFYGFDSFFTDGRS
jgi:hypothetical protein